MAKSRKKLSARIIIIFLALVILVGAIYFVYTKFIKKSEKIEGDISFHFLELGNEYAGDCIFIKAGETDVLIDAGSRSSSLETIKTYINGFCSDGILEYVIATHADQDHIACFAGTTADNSSIFDIYECKTIIDFPQTDKTTKTYMRYVEKRDKEVSNGATHYTALQCYNQTDGAKRTYALSEGVTMTILNSYYYSNKSADENNYSVCTLFTSGDKNFLLTGDLEKEGEEYLVELNNLPQVEMFKAGHHGSKTSSNEVLLSKIKPKICVVSCCAGSVEYAQEKNSTFPTQTFINRIAKYTDKVYVTTTIDVKFDSNKNKYVNDSQYKMLNGNIVVSSTKEKVSVNCSNNNTVLKEAEWFKNNRTIPSYWAS